MITSVMVGSNVVVASREGITRARTGALLALAHCTPREPEGA